jgi:NAD(P)H-hydrate epimerase
VPAENVRLLDGEAAAEWGLNPFALVEAAGRACAGVFVRSFPRFFVRSHTGEQAGGRPAAKAPAITVLAGSGNNAADALVMLRALLLKGRADPAAALVLAGRLPADGEKTPLSEALRAIQKMHVSVRAWDGKETAAPLSCADIVIDGIAGTGLQGPLRGKALEMAEAVNRLREKSGAGSRPLVVSIDLPSGNSDEWRSGMPMLTADVTLAIEPQKRCLYTPAVRSRAGRVVSAGGIFPRELIEKYQDAELLSWQDAARRLPAIPADTYKYGRGLVEIRAGAPGTAGAARLAAWGAQAAGAGLIRLVVDDSLYPVLAPAAAGIMVAPGGPSVPGGGRFQPDAVLLGPGWGRGPDRAALLEQCLPIEERGIPLILDADAVYLAKDLTFHGNAILTPHAGEFAVYTGLDKEEILAGPAPVLRRFAREKNVHILFKSHVLYAAAPDGRLGIIDGMAPALAAGGSGDVLAGICAALAGRLRAAAGKQREFDGYACTCAAAALLMEAAGSPEIAGRFIDPAELAGAAASIAGKAWLPAGSNARNVIIDPADEDDNII